MEWEGEGNGGWLGDETVPWNPVTAKPTVAAPGCTSGLHRGRGFLTQERGSACQPQDHMQIREGTEVDVFCKPKTHLRYKRNAENSKAIVHTLLKSLQKMKSDLSRAFPGCAYSSDTLHLHPEVTMILDFRSSVAFPFSILKGCCHFNGALSGIT